LSAQLNIELGAMPDGIFAYQKHQFRHIFEGLGMDIFVYIYLSVKIGKFSS
jgi:hypothetical protein